MQCSTTLCVCWRLEWYKGMPCVVISHSSARRKAIETRAEDCKGHFLHPTAECFRADLYMYMYVHVG